MNETIIVGMEIIAKVGRNEVEAIVIEVAPTVISIGAVGEGLLKNTKSLRELLLEAFLLFGHNKMTILCVIYSECSCDKLLNINIKEVSF